jgi:4'-phosphopantetheinyl transferase
LTRVLSAEEKARFGRLHSDGRKRSSIVARAASRDILGRYFGLRPEGVKIEHDSNGRPVAVGQEGFQFSLSHSAGLALCAVSRGRRVGVDVERLRSTTPVGRIAARMFSPEEAAEMLALSEADQRPAFFGLWTRKEAYAKATGESLPVALRVQLPYAESALNPGVTWTMREVSPGAGYAGAVAVEGNGWRLRRWDATLPT